jgi:predicted RNase H-like HicB family nuclease
MPDATHYTYRVTWSAEDGEHVATVAEFPSLSWLAPTPVEAYAGLENVVRDVLADLTESGEPVPEPLSEHTYSGKFMVRVPAEVHRRLAREAAEQHVSLNRLVSERLARALRPARLAQTETFDCHLPYADRHVSVSGGHPSSLPPCPGAVSVGSCSPAIASQFRRGQRGCRRSRQGSSLTPPGQGRVSVLRLLYLASSQRPSALRLTEALEGPLDLRVRCPFLRTSTRGDKK